MFRPLNDRVLVKADAEQVKSEGGIIIPDQAKEKSMQGTVIALGPGRWQDGGFKKPQVKIGDHVIFGTMGGDPIEIEGTDHLVMSEIDILGVISKRKR